MKHLNVALEVHGAGDAGARAADARPGGRLARRQQHGAEAHGQVLRGHAVVGVEGGDEAQMVQEKGQRGLVGPGVGEWESGEGHPRSAQSLPEAQTETKGKVWA